MGRRVHSGSLGLFGGALVVVVVGFIQAHHAFVGFIPFRWGYTSAGLFRARSWGRWVHLSWLGSFWSALGVVESRYST